MITDLTPSERREWADCWKVMAAAIIANPRSMPQSSRSLPEPATLLADQMIEALRERYGSGPGCSELDPRLKRDYPPAVADMRSASDCLRCCVATLLVMPYETVPDLAVGDFQRQLTVLSQWLDSLGFSLLCFQATGDGELLHSFRTGRGRLWIAGGPTARGTTHAVLYCGTEMIHDPHPSRAGLESITSAIVIMPTATTDPLVSP